MQTLFRFASNTNESLEESKKKTLTVEHMDSYSLWVGVGGVARVLPRVRLLSSLDKEITRCDVPLFRNDADSTSWRVIINLLKTHS